MRPIVWTSEALAIALTELLPESPRVVSSPQEFLDAPRDARTLAILDTATLDELDQFALALGSPDEILARRKLVNAVSLVPLIAICEHRTEVDRLVERPWLCHLIAASTLGHPMAAQHFRDLFKTFGSTTPQLTDWMNAGRRIRLTHASSGTERIARMCDWFASNGVGAEEIAVLRDAGEELLANAFYNAPFAAGAAPQPIARTQDVALPEDLACEVVYGTSANLSIVRVRDPFGSLDRPHLMTALSQQNTGLWRLVSTASLVGIAAVNDRHTEILIGIAKPGRPQPFALHLFFRGGPRRRVWRSLDEDTGLARDTVSVTVTEITE